MCFIDQIAPFPVPLHALQAQTSGREAAVSFRAEHPRPSDPMYRAARPSSATELTRAAGSPASDSAESATTVAAAAVAAPAAARRHGKGAAACRVAGCMEALHQPQNKVMPMPRPCRRARWSISPTMFGSRRAGAAVEQCKGSVGWLTAGPFHSFPSHQAHRICAAHRAAPSITAQGGPLRFCQQVREGVSV